MTIAQALIHLRSRLVDVEAKESRHRPHWSQDDIDAVTALVERPAAGEQLALARIEGRLSNMNGFDSGQRVRIVWNIAREALGLPRVT